VELATKRFLLRDFVDADAAAFEAYHNDPRSYEFNGIEEAKPGHARELISLFRAWAEGQPRINYQLAIVRRGEPESLVGCCGVRCAGSAPGTAELGIELAPEYWGRYAYAVEVMRALVEFSFDTLGLRAVYGATVDANFRVARLMTFLGATAVIRTTPDWMQRRGWTQIEWQFTRQQWKNGRLTRRSSPRAEARG
jgi:RimJ/RimL family protein N-acetyltransferase